MGAGPKDGVLRWLEEYAARLHSGRYRVAQITDAGVPPTLALSIFDQARPAAADAVIHALPHCAAHQTVQLHMVPEFSLSLPAARSSCTAPPAAPRVGPVGPWLIFTCALRRACPCCSLIALARQWRLLRRSHFCHRL